MVGRKKKTKTYEEDRLSQLPDYLITEILFHLPTKDAVRTSVLSTNWRNHWQSIPGLDLVTHNFSDISGFVSFANRFIDINRELWIRKFQLSIFDPDAKSYIGSWIDAATSHRVQHLDVHFQYLHRVPAVPVPLSLYTSQTLVHLRLCRVALVDNEFVSLPCLKIIHLEHIRFVSEANLEKLISGSPVVVDLSLIGCSSDSDNALQVRSNTLKRIHIDEETQVVIDAPLLQWLKTRSYAVKNFKIINLGFSTKLDLDVTSGQSFIRDILADIARVRDLVISNALWKDIFLHKKPGPLIEFCKLYRLSVKFAKSDVEMLPTILESCPILKSLILELVKGYKRSRETKAMFSTVPRCLVSTLRFVELKRSIAGYEGEMELVRYFLKNSTILEKLKFDACYIKKAKWSILKELLAMPRCSSICEVVVL